MLVGLKIERIQFSRVNRNQCGPEHMKWVKIKGRRQTDESVQFDQSADKS